MYINLRKLTGWLLILLAVSIVVGMPAIYWLYIVPQLPPEWIRPPFMQHGSSEVIRDCPVNCINWAATAGSLLTTVGSLFFGIRLINHKPNHF